MGVGRNKTGGLVDTVHLQLKQQGMRGGGRHSRSGSATASYHMCTLLQPATTRVLCRVHLLCYSQLLRVLCWVHLPAACATAACPCGLAAHLSAPRLRQATTCPGAGYPAAGLAGGATPGRPGSGASGRPALPRGWLGAGWWGSRAGGSTGEGEERGEHE